MILLRRLLQDPEGRLLGGGRGEEGECKWFEVEIKQA